MADRTAAATINGLFAVASSLERRDPATAFLATEFVPHHFRGRGEAPLVASPDFLPRVGAVLLDALFLGTKRCISVVVELPGTIWFKVVAAGRPRGRLPAEDGVTGTGVAVSGVAMVRWQATLGCAALLVGAASG